MASASKKNSLSLQTEGAILQVVEKFAKERSAKVKIAEKIAEKYEIPKSTLSTIIKNKETILEAFEQSTFAPSNKRMRTAAYLEFEEGFVSWVKISKCANIRAHSSNEG